MKRAICILMLTAFAAAPGLADHYGTANVRYDSMIRGLVLTGTLRDASNVLWENMLLEAGLHKLTIQDLSVSGLPPDSYLNLGYEQAFCIDLLDWKEDSFNTYKVVSLDDAPDPHAAPTGGMGEHKAAFVAELLAKSDYDSAEAAAAVQLAIWEIIAEPYDPLTGVRGWNLSEGNFFVEDASIGSIAEGLLREITTGMSFCRYTAVSHPINTMKQLQDFVVVPAPVAVLLGMLGLGAAGLKLRRFA